MNIRTFIFTFTLMLLANNLNAKQPLVLKKGKNIHIAVIDTGIDPDHPLFKNKLMVGNKKVGSIGAYGVDFSKNAHSPELPYDEHGHGTHIAGIIARFAPGAKLHVLKYYNPRATGEENLESTIKALNYAVNLGVDIINYSSGGPEKSPIEMAILKKAQKKGIIIVSAAGNESRNIDIEGNEFFPASYRFKNLITVGAHDKNENLIRSSNWGKRSVDLLAPGKNIKSTLPNGRYGYLTGTSRSTAFVSATVAKILNKSKRKIGVKSIKKILSKGSKKLSQLNKKCLSGGILDMNKSLSLISPEQKETIPGNIIYRVSQQ